MLRCMRKKLKNYKTQKINEEKAAELVEKYGNMSENALFEKLMEEVAGAKSRGSFSAAELAENVDKMRPYLTHEQVEKLNHLLRLIGS